MWCRWRHKWASGPDKTWTWLYLGDGEDHPHLGESPMEPLKEAWEKTIKDEYCPEWTGPNEMSEHYRGVEFEVVGEAPREVVEEMLHVHEELARRNTERATVFRAMLEE